MTVIRPNSISGINSITGQGGDITLFRADGIVADVIVNNITSGVITATILKVQLKVMLVVHWSKLNHASADNNRNILQMQDYLQYLHQNYSGGLPQ